MDYSVFNIAASFLIAALSGLGVGSGGLFVIWLTLVCNTPQIAAQGLNLLFFLFSAGASLFIHVSRRKILWGAVAFLTVLGIIGSLLGSFIVGFVSPSLVKKLFGAMLILSGAAALLKKSKP